MKSAEDDAVLEELRGRVQGIISYGSAEPDRNTVGNVYLKIGLSTDPVTVYIREAGTKTWIGTSGLTRTTDVNMLADNGLMIPVSIIDGRVYAR
jgi:hypothetical protein